MSLVDLIAQADEREILPVGVQLPTVGRQLHRGRRSCGLLHILGPDATLLVCNNAKFARGVDDVVPAQSIRVRLAAFPPE